MYLSIEAGSLANIGICAITTTTTISTCSLIQLFETLLPCLVPLLFVPVAQPRKTAEGSRLLPAAALHSSATHNIGYASAPGSHVTFHIPINAAVVNGALVGLLMRKYFR
jgi:hypothetical protein